MLEICGQLMDEKRLVNHLMSLLAIEGLSGREGMVSAEIRRRLLKAGCKDAWIRSDNAHKRIGKNFETGNLIVQIPGKGSLRRSPRRLFSGHMDTVPLCRGSVPVIRGSRIESSATTALGGDNRTAVAAIVSMTEFLLSEDLDHPPLTLLFTVGEEIGLYGAKEVRLSELGNPAMGFNIDGGNPDYAVIGAIGADRWAAHVYGRSTHAGVYPEGGISATLVASQAISAVAQQGYFGKVDIDGIQGTSNVGSFTGGEASNQVTDYVKVTGECRSHSRASLKKITTAYRRAFEDASRQVKNIKGKCGRVEFLVERDYDAFKMSSRAECVKRVETEISALGGIPRLVIANGGLDANYLNQRGLPTVTLGAGQHSAHTIDEYIEIPEYVRGCQLLARLAVAK